MKFDIFKSIRKNNIEIAVFCFFILIIFIPLIIQNINSSLDWRVVCDIWLLGSCCIIFSLIFFIRSIFLIVKPEKSDIIQMYGGIEGLEKILDEINDTIEYQDEKLIVSKNYVVDKNKIENLIEYKDIRHVNKWQVRRYGVILAYKLVITKTYGKDIKYHYMLGEEEKVDYLVDLISSKCKSGNIDNG